MEEFEFSDCGHLNAVNYVMICNDTYSICDDCLTIPESILFQTEVPNNMTNEYRSNLFRFLFAISRLLNENPRLTITDAYSDGFHVRLDEQEVLYVHHHRNRWLFLQFRPESKMLRTWVKSDLIRSFMTRLTIIGNIGQFGTE